MRGTALKFRISAKIVMMMLVFCCSPLVCHAYLHSGESAQDVLGQSDDSGNPSFTKASGQNGPSKIGFDPSGFSQSIAFDGVHHRLFAGDFGANNRIKV